MSSPVKPESYDSTASAELAKTMADATTDLNRVHRTPETDHGQLADSMRVAKSQYMSARENLQTIRDSGTKDTRAIQAAYDEEAIYHDKMYDKNNAYRRAKGIPEVRNPREILSNNSPEYNEIEAGR